MKIQVISEDEGRRQEVRALANRYGVSQYGTEQPNEKDPTNYWLFFNIGAEELADAFLYALRTAIPEREIRTL